VAATGVSVVDACEIARARAGEGDRVVAFGSFLTVGPALEWMIAHGLTAAG
jgi:folylpolyglutamate synthase/dihydropteroate synthase